MGKTVKNRNNSKSKKLSQKRKKISQKRKKMNLVYMAKPPYGGWVSFTAHLSKEYDYELFKIGNKTETKKREYGYGVKYQNLSIDDLLKKPNLLITAIDKKYYEYLPKIKKAKIVIHDPTELKDPVLECLKRFEVITIRETVSKLLKEKYGIKNKFLLHPFYEFPKKIDKAKKNSVSISRIDFDKHTDIILKANKNLNNPTDVYGAVNDLYVFHGKLKELGFKKYYKGKFEKSFEAIHDLLSKYKFVVDMSAIKNDGGGSQYTFLEAIYMDCALVLNSKWTSGVKTIFKDNKNCFIVSNEDELIKLINKNPNTKNIIKESRKILLPHINCSGW